MLLRWNIRRKLNIVLGLSGLVFIVISAPIISYISFSDYQRQAKVQQGRLVEAVRTSAAIATFVANEEIAGEVLNGLLQDDEILAAVITGSDQFRKQSSIFEKNEAFIIDDQVQVYPLFSPIDGNEKVGEIKIWSNTALIEKRATLIVLNNLGWLALLTIILIIASIFTTNLLVATPLRRLADQLAKSTPGQETKVEVGELHTRDEIGLVTNRVNDFIDVTRNAIEKERDLRLQIEQMNKHFSNIFSSSHVGIMVVDHQGRLLHHNPVLLERIVKVSNTDVSDSNIFSSIFADSEAMWSAVQEARSSDETQEVDLQLKSENDESCWVHCIITVNESDDDEFVVECVLYDVTKRIQEAEKAKRLAERDSLTGLSNRRGCERFIQHWMKTEKHELNLVVMILDLDSFKPVNDEYGHNSGDLVLQTIATRLKSEVRSNIDLVGRVGGDEFIVFLKMNQPKNESVSQVAQKIIDRVSEPILIMDDKKVQIGVSIGIAYANRYESLDDLMQAADQAMYQVKAKGKNDFIFAE